MAAEVVNVSCTGALVRATKQQAPGTQCSLRLEAGGAPLELTARIVRCEPVAGPLRVSTGQFALALAFVNLSPAAQAHLERLCGNGRSSDDARRIHMSLERRCPSCESRDVVKESRRHYSCTQCGRVFAGFRVGFLRFSR
jgi:DNA-directed RNA polymerase subunit RPC12/RpoP